jgi:TolB-like protein
MPEGAGEDAQSQPATGSPFIAEAKVFVSYASQDTAVANTVVVAFERAGITCWIAPRDVMAGAFYADAIVHAIDSALCLVLILSKCAADSHHVLREIERAASKRRPLITLKIDAVPLPAAFEYFLNPSQWLDASDGHPERQLPKLIEALRGVRLGPPRTPQGLKSTQAPTFRFRKAIVGALALVVATGTGYVVVEKPWHWNERAHAQHSSAHATFPAQPVPGAAAFAPPPHSIAVLPFVNMSEDAKQEYFSDGVSEELLNALARIRELQVVARTSSFSFKGQNVDVSTIAHKLNVGAVLEGSVRRAGNTVRITVQLIDAVSGFHLWSQTYDRSLRDILKVQTEVASSVAQQLKITLFADEREKSVVHDISPDAYTFYLQGRQALHNANTKAASDNAAELFRRSVAADPGFAKGWFYLEAALSDEVITGLDKADVVSAEMRHAADMVVTIEPGSATAHRAAAQIYWSLDWNWPAATAEYERAYELNPGDSISVRQLADVTHTILSNDTAALSLYQRAIGLDPLNAFSYLHIGFYYLDIGRLPEAESAFRQSLVLNPKGEATTALCQALVAGGKANEALAVLPRVPDDSDRRLSTALVYQALGRKKEADAALADAERMDAEENAYSIAEIHAYRGETDQAFVWLDRAYRQREFSLNSLRTDPLLNTLKGDPRYKAFLRKMHLPA